MNHASQKIKEFQTLAGNPLYISCNGKTFLDTTSPEFLFAKEIGELLIEQGFGIIHGGYTGIMQAVSEGADIAIDRDTRKSIHLNIGVPLAHINNELPLSSRVNCPPAQTLFERQELLLTHASAALIFPSGGFGTLAEAVQLFHMNQHAKKFNTDVVRPIIFIGGPWKQIFAHLVSHLDMNNQSIGEESTYFIETKEELLDILKKL